MGLQRGDLRPEKMTICSPLQLIKLFNLGNAITVSRTYHKAGEWNVLGNMRRLVHLKYNYQLVM